MRKAMKYGTAVCLTLLPLMAFVRTPTDSNATERTRTQATFHAKGFTYGPNNEELNLDEPGRTGCTRTWVIDVDWWHQHAYSAYIDGAVNCTVPGDNPVYGETYQGGDVLGYIPIDSVTYMADNIVADGYENFEFTAPATDTVHLQAMARTGYTFLYWRAYANEPIAGGFTQYNSSTLAIPVGDLNTKWIYAEFKKNP